MGETLTQRRRVKDEGLMIVNFLICHLAEDKVPANYVPAAAVKRRGLALSGFIGRKGCVGGYRKFSVKFWGSTPKPRRILLNLRKVGAVGT
jgi:hypothetical protein